MATRAERSDEAYAAIAADADAVRSAIDAQRATDASETLARLEQRAARAAETLGAYDARRARELLAQLTRDVAKLKRRPRFAFKSVAAAPAAAPAATPPAARLPPPKEDVQDDEHADADVAGRVDAHLQLVGAGAAGAVRLVGLERCVVVAGDVVGGSALVRGCRRCVIALRARQVRVHSCEDCVLLLETATGPIIEGCRGLVVGPFARHGELTGGAGTAFERVSLGVGHADTNAGNVTLSDGAWRQVVDFDCAGGKSTNYRLLAANEAVPPVRKGGAQ